MKESQTWIGKPVSRVDGYAKVTGAARYAAEFKSDGLVYGVVVSSDVTKGKILKIDSRSALACDGVIEVITHENRPKVSFWNRKFGDQDSPPGDHFRALYDSEVYYSGQPVALVIAETFEAARYAAKLVVITYELEEYETDFHSRLEEAYAPKETKPGFEKPKSRGDADEAFSQAPHKISAEYDSPTQHHNPMEMHATTVVYEGDDTYTIYDKTQGTANSQAYVCQVFGLSPKKVRVRAPFVGGAFGSGLRPQYQLYLAVMAAKKLQRSVRVVLTRQQMFSFGHRPASVQTVKLSAGEDGVLHSVGHSVTAETSQLEDYMENVVSWSGMLYKCENVEVKHELVKADIFTPLDMRAPGATSGLFALESAMDELSYEIGMDPLELRLANYTEKDQNYFGRSFSSKELRACYEQGAAKFGWSKRALKPRSLREGKKWIGQGVATGVWDALHMKSTASAEFTSKGELKITSGVTDIGTGTYTILTQIAAETLGLNLENVTTSIGDTDFTPAPLQGGSWTAGSMGSATQAACFAVREKIFKLAKKLPDSPFSDAELSDVLFEGGEMLLKKDPSRSVSLNDVLKSSRVDSVKAEGTSAPNYLKELPHARNTHSAVFAEVKVDADFGMIEVSRVVVAVAAGKILNPKTARSQILGGVVWGMSQALFEETVTDHRLGRILNHSFAEYHIPVNRDVPEIDVIFVPEADSIVNELGVKGLGEIGIVGTAAAVANAVFHATGKRVRNLPIRPDKMV
ncbi:MAG: xanthine dehydrogenase family protein molybdopterin-binding subunit [Cryobacterium sp.]|nr:xanthine dehydrogenase family protein molybdopterin-binding subunit [Oligoflexia bacterium]